jgi:hypothetical protein
MTISQSNRMLSLLCFKIVLLEFVLRVCLLSIWRGKISFVGDEMGAVRVMLPLGGRNSIDFLLRRVLRQATAGL